VLYWAREGWGLVCRYHVNGRPDISAGEFKETGEQNTSMRLHYKAATVLFFLCGTALRLLLCWVNPPYNAFDDHFQPIFLIMNTGAIPAKDACWQCYHPPVFYWLSAMVGKIAMKMGAESAQVLKILQFIPCLYGILTLWVIYLILKRLPLSKFSKLIAFGTICFLPRHIYMSAMNSNDTISYLFVSLTVLLLLTAIEKKLSAHTLTAATVIISITLFTKYTSFVVFPVIIVSFALLFLKDRVVSRKKAAASMLLILFLPTLLLSSYAISNIKTYGSPLPWNVTKMDPTLTHARDDTPPDFISFTPWQSIITPYIAPGKIHRFWTLVYSGMWFDNEPKFLYFLDSNLSWWRRYYAWIRGEMAYPGDNTAMSLLTRLSAAGLITMGLLPLLLIIAGIFQLFRGIRKAWTADGIGETAALSIFPVLLLSNTAGIIALVRRLPSFSSMKASYFLNSMSAFAVFCSLGLMLCEKNKKIQIAVGIWFGVLFALVTVHILQIFYSLR
jgi:4-amino-4-deoxy-L-arabinose transferase-like glycosyltransferase